MDPSAHLYKLQYSHSTPYRECLLRSTVLWQKILLHIMKRICEGVESPVFVLTSVQKSIF